MFKAFIGALLGAAGFGTANVVIKKSLSDTSIPQVLAMSMGSGVMCLALLVGMTGIPSVLSWQLIGTMMLCGVVEIGIYLTLYKSLESSNVTMAIAIINSNPIFAAIITVLFLGEVLSLLQVLCIILMISGTIVISIDWGNFSQQGLRFSNLLKGIGWIIVCMLLHAAYFPALAKFTESGDWQFKLLGIKFFALVFIVLIFFVIKGAKFKPGKKRLSAGALLGLLEIMGWIGLSWASSNTTGMIAIIVVVLQAAPIVTAILAYFFLNEKLHGLQYLGVVMIVASLTGLALA